MINRLKAQTIEINFLVTDRYVIFNLIAIVIILLATIYLITCEYIN